MLQPKKRASAIRFLVLTARARPVMILRRIPASIPVLRESSAAVSSFLAIHALRTGAADSNVRMLLPRSAQQQGHHLLIDAVRLLFIRTRQPPGLRERRRGKFKLHKNARIVAQA